MFRSPQSVRGTRVAGCTSRGIARLGTLDACLTEFADLVSLNRPIRPAVDAVIGWGLKPTADRARTLAHRLEVPYVALEDGFLRSSGLGVSGEPPHSLVVDHSGIYYDAGRPSDLETLIRDGHYDDAELARARRCMALIRRYRLSKYNHAPDTPLPETTRRRVLVVDQTHGDASIRHGGAGDDSFPALLAQAIAENPDAEVLVKVHPDVVAGKKTGHLLEAARAQDCRVIAEDLNPWALLDAVDSVYVVTSQLGFEALMAGKRVVCHGLPFYAGWGLTEDRQACSRRGVSRSLEVLFAAAYLRYSRYANPITGTPCALEDSIHLIADQRRHRLRHAGDWVVYGLSRWKRGFVGDFLGPAARVRHERRLAVPERGADERHLVWASDVDATLERRYRARQQAPWRMEDGFMRSVGLGADLVRPLSLVIDAQGIYYDASRPSDLEQLLNETTFTPDLLERAARLRQRVVDLRLSKYNVAGAGLPTLPRNRPLVLVPGQVESDASIIRGSPEITTNRDLLAAVRAAHPEAFILYKPHPDVVSQARRGSLGAGDEGLYDLEVGGVEIAALLDVVDEVHTMSSLTGFEGLLRGLPVTTYGLPFYAGWGLTRDRLRCDRRRRRLTLDALVAGTLILYPTYVAPGCRRVCNAETVITLLEQQKATATSLTWKTRLYRRYRSLFIGTH